MSDSYSEWVVAIPSFHREMTVSSRTLKVLKEGSVPSERIYIFVQDEEQKLSYQNCVSPKLYREIVIGGFGIHGQRNAITQYFADGQAIISMDDDIVGVKTLQSAGKLKPIDNLHIWFNDCFKALHVTKTTLWGIYPTPNPFYMSNEIALGLYFCIGQIHGVINQKDEILTLNEKEDYERSLLRFKKDGAVLRFNDVAAQTAGNYSEPGGCQDNKRSSRSEIAAKSLLERFPGLVRLNTRRKGKHAQILLVNPRRSS